MDNFEALSLKLKNATAVTKKKKMTHFSKKKLAQKIYELSNVWLSLV
jgi:hypothetical protein